MLKKLFIFFFLLIGVATYSQTDIPDEPEFISASVIPESMPTEVSLKWNPSDSLDVTGYIIYKVVSTVTQTIDTVWGRLNNEYVYNASQSGISPEQFRLAAIDNLFFKSKITDPHTTIFLSSQYDKCNNIVNLSWTAYSGWTNGINKYNIYRREQDGTYSLLSSVGSTALNYHDDEVEFNKSYYYYIEAISNSAFSATSNSVKVLSESYILPQYLYAEFATVTDQDIVVKFIMDNSAEVSEYRIQRALSVDGTYSTIHSFVNTGESEVLFTDTDVNVDETKYYYRIASVNPCGVVNMYSNYSTNIILSAEKLENLHHNVEWTQYEDWAGGVFDYHVYRVFDGTGSEIAVNTHDDLNYEYDIAWYVNYCHDRAIYMTNKFCYYVEAYENLGHNYSSNIGISRSNVSCVYHDPVIW
ncbi:MAG TPA: hypothetical protein PLL66_05295, partial [Bacteroidales bacterium]|nr:hypothetical protein [Bacteroidales bacterium]